MKTHFLGIRLRGGNKKTFHIDKLTKKQWERVEKCRDLTCGLTTPMWSRIIEIPNLLFLNECKKHDLMTSRGGGLLDLYDTNYYFWKFNFIDLFEFWLFLIKWTFKKPAVNAVVYMTILTIVGLPIGFVVTVAFSLFATIGDIFVFDYGEYKTFEEIMKKRCNKNEYDNSIKI